MTQKMKAALLHWLFEFVGGLILVAAGGLILYFFPWAQIATTVYTGHLGSAIILIGALFAANSVRRAIFKKKAP